MYMEHLNAGMLGVRKLMSSIALDKLQLKVVARAADTGEPGPHGELRPHSENRAQKGQGGG